MRRSASTFALGALVLCLTVAGTDAQEAVYRLRGQQLPIASVSSGYVQTVTELADGLVEVQVSAPLGPIGPTAAYVGSRSLPAAGVPDGFVLPDSMVPLLRAPVSEWEAATRVQEWVARHVSLDEEDVGPQDATSVLTRGRGRCSGVANVAVALLMASGFEARTLSGLLVTGDGPIPHRWLECRLAGAGWVPSDPTIGPWVVTPRHLLFERTVVRLPEVEVLRLVDARLSSLPRRKGRPVRPDTGARLLCSITGHSGSTVVATLRGPSGEVRWAVADPMAEFSGLLPGRWLLEVAEGGAVLERASLTLVQDQVHRYTVDLADRS